MAGLIWANLGKGISDVGQQWGRQAFQLELLRLEEEKALRLDAIKRDRDVADIPRKAEATAAAAPVLAQGEVAALDITEPARTRLASEREETLRPGKIETARQTGLVAGEVDRANSAAYAEDPAARSGTRAKTTDSESSATRAAAETARFDLSQKKALADLRTQLSKSTDETERATIEQQIKDLSVPGTRGYGDMVTAAGHYRMLAQNLRKDAELATSDAERNDMLKRARYYETEADAILQTTTSKRLGNKPKASSGPNSESVGTTSSSRYKEGDVVNLKSGGQGRVVNINGQLMVKPL